MTKRKWINRFIVAFAVVSFTLIAFTLAYLTDRIEHQMKFTTAVFNDDGYAIERTAPAGPFVAGENIELFLKETNAKEETVQSTVSLSATWDSPDTTSSIFGNSNADDNAVLTLGDEEIAYTVSNDQKSISFSLPKQLLESTAVGRSVTLTLPASLVSTGTVTFSVDDVVLEQYPDGFSTEFSAQDLSSLSCSTQVVWAASESTGSLNSNKALYGYLNDDCSSIIFELGFNYNISPMMDFVSATASPWSIYKNNITSLSFPEGMTTVGDYAFAGFSEVTSVSFPATTGGIGTCSFDGAGLTGTLTIPSTVNTIESLAFGNLPNVTTIVFEHTASDPLTLPDNSSEGDKSSGAFYVPSYLETTFNFNGNSSAESYAWANDNRLLTPIALEITSPPTKTAYIDGEDFDKTGMVVTVSFSDGSSKVISDYVITNGTALAEGQTSVTITYTLNGVTKTTEVDITVEPADILITYDANNGEFNAGNVTNEVVYDRDTHEVVSGTYADPARTDYTFLGWYTDAAGTDGTEFDLSTVTASTTVYAKWKSNLKSIAITTQPTKTAYEEGATFNTSGMVVTATYMDGSTATVTGYSFSPSDALASSDTQVIISYTENNITKTASVAITVDYRSIALTSTHVTNLGLTSGAITVPSTIVVDDVTYRVTSIGSMAFRNQTGITSVTIPSSVTSIGSYAFNGCSSLRSVSIPNSVTSIGARAFASSGITSLTLPSSVTSIESATFYDCDSLSSFTIPSTVKSIGSMAFQGSNNLRSITISNGVTSIGKQAFAATGISTLTIPASVSSISPNLFSGVSSCSAITVDENNPYYCSQDGILFSKDKTLLHSCPPVKTGSYTIPNTVTAIGEYAFYYSSLSSISIPNTVTTLGTSVFSCSDITSLTIPSSVESLATSMCFQCYSLRSVTIPEGITSIPTTAFRGCNVLTSVSIPSTITSIGKQAFCQCAALTKITIPDAVTSIGTSAFYAIDYTAITVTTNNTVATSYDWASDNRSATFVALSSVEEAQVSKLSEEMSVSEEAAEEQELQSSFSAVNDTATLDTSAEPLEYSSESSLAVPNTEEPSTEDLNTGEDLSSDLHSSDCSDAETEVQPSVE